MFSQISVLLKKMDSVRNDLSKEYGGARGIDPRGGRSI